MNMSMLPKLNKLKVLLFPIVLLALSFFPMISFSQVDHERMDSLMSDLKQSSADTHRVRTMIHIAFDFAQAYQTDSAMAYSRTLLELSKELDYGYGIGAGYRDLGCWHWDLGNLDSAEYLLDQSIKQFELNGDMRRFCGSIFNKGLVLEAKGRFDRALEHYLIALKQFEKEVAVSMSNEANLMKP